MNAGFLWIAVAYLLLGLLVWWWESKRIVRAGVDLITVFLLFCLLQTCIAAIAIYALLPITDVAAPTTNPVFDRIFQATTLANASLVLCLTGWFIVWFYGGCGLAALVLPQGSEGRPRFRLVARGWRLAAVLACGLALTLFSFVNLGDSLTSRYANLILFRNLSDTVPRTALRATAFTLTQTWSWLSVLAMFLLYGRGNGKWLRVGTVALAIAFAVLGVSRRAFFLPILFIYVTLVLHNRRWYVGWILLAALPGVLWVSFGKQLFAAVAFGVPLDTVVGTYQSIPSALLRAASELGITVVESLGTLAFIPGQMRFGLDHVISLAQRFPEGMLGFNIDWPQRMVRISTEAFASHDAPDIPPGLAGQMWLDFRLLGPVVWGLMLGLQVGAAQWLFSRVDRSLGAAAAGVLVIFVLSLPVNTGSYDFTFSLDIIILFVVMVTCLKLRALSGDGRGASGMDASVGPAIIGCGGEGEPSSIAP